MPPRKQTPPPKPQPERPLKTLDRVLSKAGLGSRTEARNWIGGRVRVNGKLVQTPDHWVDLDRDQVTFDGQPLQEPQKLYLLLYKPEGYITTYKDPQGRPTVYDLIPEVERFVGTVQARQATGLLLLTNDTRFAESVTSPDHKIPKTYPVKASTLSPPPNSTSSAKASSLSDGPTRPAQVQHIRDSAKYTYLEITITEGRNRQVRRMIEALGSKVLKLVRTRIGPLDLTGLEIGKYRELTPAEIRLLLHPR